MDGDGSGDRADAPESRFLRVGNLTRAVNAAHLEEILAHYGTIARVELAYDRTKNMPKGRALGLF
jgi:RNA recognition motif-containing protein